MAAIPSQRNGSVPSRIADIRPVGLPAPTLPATDQHAILFGPPPASCAPLRQLLPPWYVTLEPAKPLAVINDDPVVSPVAAASILGVTADCLKKWRQRNQGPDYIQYGHNGPVRYAISALLAFRDAHTVRIREKQ